MSKSEPLRLRFCSTNSDTDVGSGSDLTYTCIDYESDNFGKGICSTA